MNAWRCLARLTVLAAVILLESCFDGREEYWVDASGGGCADITYCLSASAVAMHGGNDKIRDAVNAFLKDSPAITHSACEVVTEGDHTRVRVRAIYGSAMDLMDTMKDQSINRLPSAAVHLAGEVKTTLHGRTIDVTRTVSVAKAVPGCLLLPGSAFAGKRMVYIIHLPASPTGSNATRTDDGGRTLVWDIPLSQAVKTDSVIHFNLLIPIPWLLVSAAGVVVLPTLGLTFWLLRRRRKRS